MKEIIHFYRKVEEKLEHCFNVETEPLTKGELEILSWLLAETFEPEKFGANSFFDEEQVMEFGPRLNVATPWNTNALSILRACGITKVTRIERSRRYQQAANAHYDRMTECLYPEPLKTFETGIKPEAVYEIPLMEKGPDVLIDYGIRDPEERKYYHWYFVEYEKRNPKNVEIKDLEGCNSEHSRHGFFKGIQVIDGIKMPKTLMEIVQATLNNPRNSIIAFNDNSSGIRGYNINTIVPKYPGQASCFVKGEFLYHIIFTAETHNFPSGVAPFPGAETGTGGRIRDVQATGKGGLVVAGTAGYCVGNLRIPGYDLPWEDKSFIYPKNLTSPLQIEIEASNGASRYGNEFGEPVIQGFTRSFGMKLPDGERSEWIKPIMFTGGIGQIPDGNIKKDEPKIGMKIVQVGGPAYNIGFGGGAASSMMQGENKEELDFNAVQRGDAEMEQKMNRVVRACVELGTLNPIRSAHDQGALGPANVLKELVEKSGGKIEIRKIRLGDTTLSVLVIWVAEYQERLGFLIDADRVEEFISICEREKVFPEILGEVTGDGRFVVHDSNDDSTPVNFDLERVLGKMPQKTFSDTRIPLALKPLELPEDLTMCEALERVLRNVAVGSKRFLTNKVDRSVTGLVARQQCVGPLQLPLADVAVIAQSHFGLTGAAISIGERPLIGLIDPGAQGRMTVAEMLTNIVWAKISSLEDIKCSGNWMSAPKLPGEGAKLYDTAVAMRDIMLTLGIAIDGGKDSLSMATKVKESGELVKSPGQLVISGYCTMPDITKVVTPDFKSPGSSRIIFIDLANKKRRLGGSALAQCYKQIGNECPDMEDAELLKRAFLAIQKLIEKDLLLAGHDVSDGGLIVTLLEMAFAGNCGFRITGERSVAEWFAEEVGLVIECGWDWSEVIDILKDYDVPFDYLGFTQPTIKTISILNAEKIVLEADMRELRGIGEETSKQLDLQTQYSKINPECVREEYANIYDRPGSTYKLSFVPEKTSFRLMNAKNKPKVAIIREEGSNGDREMTSAFFQAGFECWDVTMTDLLEGHITLKDFRGIAFVGGFSYADVLDSAKGWAGVIRFNPKLWEQFQEFYHRKDTFSLGICNGCQLMALLGWVPFKGLPDVEQPRFIHNKSGRFESRWTTVGIFESPAIMLKGMEGSRLGVWTAHGEGRIYFPKELLDMEKNYATVNLAPLKYVDDDGQVTDAYPFNPNGSDYGITSLCSMDGRHLAMMPHPERAFLNWQWGYLPQGWDPKQVSPWMRMFQNALKWCDETK